MKEYTTKGSEQSRKKSCHHERHLNGIVLKIYNLFWRMGKKAEGGWVTISNRQIAKLIGAHQPTGRYGGKHC